MARRLDKCLGSMYLEPMTTIRHEVRSASDDELLNSDDIYDKMAAASDPESESYDPSRYESLKALWTEITAEMRQRGLLD